MLRQTLSAVSQNPRDWNSIFQLIRLFDLHQDKSESVSNLIKLAEIVAETNQHFAKRILKKAVLLDFEKHLALNTPEEAILRFSAILISNFLKQKPATLRSPELDQTIQSILSHQERLNAEKVQQKEHLPGLEIQINSAEKNKKARSKTVVGRIVIAPSPLRPKSSQSIVSHTPAPKKMPEESSKLSSSNANFEKFFLDSKLPKQFHSLAAHFSNTPEGILLFCSHLYQLPSFSDKNKKLLCTKLGKFFNQYNTNVEFSRFAHANFPYFAENFLVKELNFS
jgi:hypothetical protein